MSDTTPTPSPNLNLSCPYCGGSLYVSTKWEGYGYGGDKVTDAIECEGESWCNAEWETNGTLRTQPLFVQHLEIYNRAEGYSPTQK